MIGRPICLDTTLFPDLPHTRRFAAHVVEPIAVYLPLRPDSVLLHYTYWTVPHPPPSLIHAIRPHAPPLFRLLWFPYLCLTLQRTDNAFIVNVFVCILLDTYRFYLLPLLYTAAFISILQ